MKARIFLLSSRGLFLTVNSNAVISRCKEAAKITGLFTRVAGRLQVSTTHVREVAVGKRTSDRVMRELIAEITQIERRERLATRRAYTSQLKQEQQERAA